MTRDDSGAVISQVIIDLMTAGALWTVFKLVAT